MPETKTHPHMQPMEKTFPLWYPVDNTAKIYSSTADSHNTTFYRLTVILKQSVDPKVLQAAVDAIMPRFPYCHVRRRPGIFWYFLEYTDAPVRIIPDTTDPCVKIKGVKKEPFPFRIRFGQRSITIEMAHYITDGTGAMSFLKALTAEYLVQTGVEANDWTGVMHKGQEPDPEESEDAFLRYNRNTLPKPIKASRAFHIPFLTINKHHYRTVTGIVPLDKMLALAKEKKVSLNDLILSLYIDTFQKFFYTLPKFMQRGFIRVAVPVNLRKMYPSITMRNFFTPMPVEIDPRLGYYQFDEILHTVHHTLKNEITEKTIAKQISRNVRGETSPFIKPVPLFVKNFILQVVQKQGENEITSGISNMGAFNVPDWMNVHIDSVRFFPPPNRFTKIHSTIISFNNKLAITLGKKVIESDIERIFFRSLIKLGIPVYITTDKE